MSPYSVRVKLAGLCRAHGYRLITFRLDKGGLYLIRIQWDPMYGKAGNISEFTAKLGDAVAVVNAYVTAASGVYFFPRR